MVRFRLLVARALCPPRRLLNKLKDKTVTGGLNVITRSKKLKQKFNEASSTTGSSTKKTVSGQRQRRIKL